jgi:(p)ppGpp synthase/HD superfamily hydrolase
LHGRSTRTRNENILETHLEEVGGIAERAGMSETAIAAAWLHDVVEDTNATIPEIYGKFGTAVALIVLDLTDTPPGAA